MSELECEAATNCGFSAFRSSFACCVSSIAASLDDVYGVGGFQQEIAFSNNVSNNNRGHGRSNRQHAPHPPPPPGNLFQQSGEFPGAAQWPGFFVVSADSDWLVIGNTMNLPSHEPMSDSLPVLTLSNCLM